MRNKINDEPLHLHWYTLGHCISTLNVTNIDKLQSILANVEIDSIVNTGSPLYTYNQIKTEAGHHTTVALNKALEGAFDTFNALFKNDGINLAFNGTVGLAHYLSEDYENNAYSVKGSTYERFTSSILPRLRDLYERGTTQDIDNDTSLHIGEGNSDYRNFMTIALEGNFESDIPEYLKDDIDITDCICVLKRQFETAEICTQTDTTPTKTNYSHNTEGYSLKNRKPLTKHSAMITTARTPSSSDAGGCSNVNGSK